MINLPSSKNSDNCQTKKRSESSIALQWLLSLFFFDTMAESHHSSSSSAASSIGTGSRSSRRSGAASTTTGYSTSDSLRGVSVHQRSHGGHFKAHSSFRKEHPFERIQGTDFQKGAENPQVTVNLNLIGRKFRHILPPKTLIYRTR